MPDGYALAQMRPLENVPLPIFEDFFHTLTMPVFFMVILTLLAAIWMHYSPTGRAIYAVGGNAEAARLSGISEHRIIMTAFTLNGVFVGIAAVLNATQFSVIQVTLPPIELLIITATVVGGVSILGGTARSSARCWPRSCSIRSRRRWCSWIFRPSGHAPFRAS
jgi:ribose/xylose/arabinose/galactoside ABC-type transport system permease subunit